MSRLYVDSADRQVVERWLSTGLFAGVTTNPLLCQRAGVTVDDLPELYEWATKAGAKEVFLQAWGRDARMLRSRAEELLALGPRSVVKLPATEDGITVAAALAAEGHPVLLTAVYDAKQAVLAAAAGVDYIAPYLGRMNDAGHDGLDEVASMHRVLATAPGTCRVLAASIREPAEVVRLAQAGVGCFTLSPAVIEAFFEESSTAQATQDFEDAVGQGTGPAA